MAVHFLQLFPFRKSHLVSCWFHLSVSRETDCIMAAAFHIIQQWPSGFDLSSFLHLLHISSILPSLSIYDPSLSVLCTHELPPEFPKQNGWRPDKWHLSAPFSTGGGNFHRPRGRPLKKKPVNPKLHYFSWIERAVASATDERIPFDLISPHKFSKLLPCHCWKDKSGILPDSKGGKVGKSRATGKKLQSDWNWLFSSQNYHTFSKHLDKNMSASVFKYWSH